MSFTGTLAAFGLGYFLAHRKFPYGPYSKAENWRDYFKNVAMDKLDYLFFGVPGMRSIRNGDPARRGVPGYGYLGNRNYNPYNNYTNYTTYARNLDQDYPREDDCDDEDRSYNIKYYLNRQDVVVLLHDLKAIAQEYGCATLTDYYDLTQQISEIRDSKLKWTEEDLTDDETIIQYMYGHGWYLDLPEPESVD